MERRFPACLAARQKFWMRLQSEYDLKKAAQNKKVMERVGRIVPVKVVEEIRRCLSQMAEVTPANSNRR